MRRLAACLALLCFSTHSTAAELSETVVHVEDMARPSLEAVALTAPPSIDGRVRADDAWSGVTPTSGFRQVRPFEGQPASQRTEVFVGYTDTALYIGVICYDESPNDIVVRNSKRDSSLDDTDSFAVIFDVYHDERNGLVFGTTPTSVEYDGQVTNEGAGGFRSGGAFNLNWDTNWSVRSSIHADGWSAEMEIPFTSLRYGGGDQQHWGINFQRNIRRNNEEAYLGAVAAPAQSLPGVAAGDLEGLESPRSAT